MSKNGKTRRGRAVARRVSEKRVDLRVRVSPATLARIGQLARSKHISKGELLDTLLRRTTPSGRPIFTEAEMMKRDCPYPPEPDL